MGGQSKSRDEALNGEAKIYGRNRSGEWVWVSSFRGERLGKHLREGRGVQREDEKELGFTHLGLGETHTLTIPYRDPVGNLKGFAVMSVDSSGKSDGKYLWTTDRDALLNLNEARGRGVVVVVKDPLDALISSQRGAREVAATGGGSLSVD